MASLKSRHCTSCRNWPVFFAFFLVVSLSSHIQISSCDDSLENKNDEQGNLIGNLFPSESLPMRLLPLRSLYHLIRSPPVQNFILRANASLQGQSGSQFGKGITTSEIIERAGFSSEIHSLNTEDGYILQVHRIRTLKSSGAQENEQKRPAVLFLPGLLACADSWLSNEPEKNLPFILANLSYDVWLLNPRGCAYSRNHTSKNPNSTEFWNFSFEEIGIYDLAGTTDYILEKTGQPKLNLVGISMGTTANLVLLSERPEYNKKINMSINLAPTAFFTAPSPLLRYGASMYRLLPKSAFSEFLTGGSDEFMPKTDVMHHYIRQLCSQKEYRETCAAFVFAINGFDTCQVDEIKLTQMLEIYPAGTSIWTLIHYLQLVNSREFTKFDYGRRKNLMKYKRMKPPTYNLKNIQSPQIFFWGENDWMANPKDVAKLAEKLPQGSLKEMCRIKFKNFNQLDFALAKDVNLLVNDRVVRVLQGQSCWDNDLEQDDRLYESEESVQCPPQNKNVSMISRSFRRAFESLAKNLA